MNEIIFMFFLLVFIWAVKAECPDGWDLYPASGFCYKAFEGRENEVSWTQAESTCNTFGADLVSFEDEKPRFKM